MRVEAGRRGIIVRALISPRQRKGSAFVPMHWTDQAASSARVDRLVAPITDPFSGQPALKNTAVAVRRFDAAIFGFAVLSEKPPSIDADYWALARTTGGWRIELAFSDAVRDWAALAAHLFGETGDAETLSFVDLASGRRRFARFSGDRLVGALFLAPEPVAVSRSWAAEQLSAEHRGQRARLAVLAARPGGVAADRGAVVCACFSVGSRQIADAAERGCVTVDAIGAALQAGTNCGSCRAEIRSIIEASRLQAAE